MPRSPGSRACSFSACSGSTTTQGRPTARASAAGRIAFPFCPQGRRPELVLRSSIPGPPMPLSTRRPPPHDDARKTQGQDGSLLLSCRTLSFPTTCRFIPAHGQPTSSHRRTTDQKANDAASINLQVLRVLSVSFQLFACTFSLTGPAKAEMITHRIIYRGDSFLCFFDGFYNELGLLA